MYIGEQKKKSKHKENKKTNSDINRTCIKITLLGSNSLCKQDRDNKYFHSSHILILHATFNPPTNEKGVANFSQF